MLQDILRLPTLQEIHDEWRFTEGNCQRLMVSSYVDSSHKDIQALIHRLHSEVCSYLYANLAFVLTLTPVMVIFKLKTNIVKIIQTYVPITC
jgi:hypothetical protein